MGFTYTDEQWATIAKALSDGGYNGSHPVRSILETQIALFLQRQRPRSKDAKKTATTIYKAASTIVSAASTEEGLSILKDATAGAPHFLLDDAKRLAGVAQKWVSPRPVTERQHLRTVTEILLLTWQTLTGKIGVSRDKDGETPSGPLIRFLIAAAEPAGVTLTLHQADAAARFRKRLTVLRR